MAITAPASIDEAQIKQMEAVSRQLSEFLPALGIDPSRVPPKGQAPLCKTVQCYREWTEQRSTLNQAQQEDILKRWKAAYDVATQELATLQSRVGSHKKLDKANSPMEALEERVKAQNKRDVYYGLNEEAGNQGLVVTGLRSHVQSVYGKHMLDFRNQNNPFSLASILATFELMRGANSPDAVIKAEMIKVASNYNLEHRVKQLNGADPHGPQISISDALSRARMKADLWNKDPAHQNRQIIVRADSKGNPIYLSSSHGNHAIDRLLARSLSVEVDKYIAGQGPITVEQGSNGDLWFMDNGSKLLETNDQLRKDLIARTEIGLASAQTGKPWLTGLSLALQDSNTASVKFGAGQVPPAADPAAAIPSAPPAETGTAAAATGRGPGTTLGRSAVAAIPSDENPAPAPTT